MDAALDARRSAAHGGLGVGIWTGRAAYNARMIFSWLKRRRRGRLLQTPFPSDWLEFLERNVPHYARLTPDEQQKLRRDAQVFVAEKNWEGCGGLTVDAK